MKLFSDSTPPRLPLTFESPAEGIALVKENERSFDARLDAAAREICADCLSHGVKIIRLSGPTCAGKTTTAHKLTAVLEKAGRLAMAEKSPAGKLDYDSGATIDLPALSTCIRDLMEKGSARIPQFDFVTGYAESYRDLTVPEGVEPIFLFEGIQAVYPEVAALFEGIPERSIFINVMKETVLAEPDGGERVFSPEDIRLLRRLVRDEAKRGTAPDFTLELWHSVRDNEERSIYPNAPACDYGIDSNMAFDIHMLAPHLRHIFAEHPCDGDEVEWAARILASIEGVEGISPDCLAPNSLYHEFILI